MEMVVELKKLRNDAKIPAAGSSLSAGYDLYASFDGEEIQEIRIPPQSSALIGTGLSAAIPPGSFGGIFARSGLALKMGLRPANCVGVIDSDYRGEIKVALYNDSGEDRIVRKGDRIAQLILLPCLEATFREVEELGETQRGDGGFGHTGMN